MPSASAVLFTLLLLQGIVGKALITPGPPHALNDNSITLAPGDFPISNIDGTLSKPSDTLTLTSPSRTDASALNPITPLAEFPVSILFCPEFNCTATCTVAELGSTQPNFCFGAGTSFNSVAIVQPSNEGLSFGVLVGPPGCELFAQIPTVNECFNLNGGPFTDFELVN